MSNPNEVVRYELLPDFYHQNQLKEAVDGDWVKYSDYEAEVKRRVELEKEVFILNQRIVGIMNDNHLREVHLESKLTQANERAKELEKFINHVPNCNYLWSSSGDTKSCNCGLTKLLETKLEGE